MLRLSVQSYFNLINNDFYYLKPLFAKLSVPLFALNNNNNNCVGYAQQAI